MIRCDVVVVGGGVAGLAAAGRLAEAGRRVILIEARARLGGRVHTVLDPAGEHPIELGAEFVQGRSADLVQVLHRARLPLQEVPERHQRGHGHGTKPLLDVESLADRLRESALPKVGDVPVAQAIREAAGADFTTDEMEALTDYLEGFHAADLERFGTAALAENEAAMAKDGPSVVRLEGGYGTLASALRSWLNPDLVRVQTETIVTGLRWRTGEVEVEARRPNGDAIELAASQAVLTVPLGVLKAGKESEGSVDLDPLPTGWPEALGALEMGAARRIDLWFDTAWWMEANRPPPMFVLGRDQPFPVWWTTATPSLPFITGWVGGPRAQVMAGRTHDEVARLALQSAASIFGRTVQMLESRVRAVYTHDWSMDSFSRGAYSYGGVGALAARESLRRPVAGTLFLAGEALAGEGLNGTVSGALTSGLQAAAILLEVPATTLPNRYE
ncbi:MAG TPA: NAD(P)/FAD-dependent oxidoreductase [Gemmatimonadales bacterium]|nr:NAD(P)/FAD-dependent oxidoreductase [Gemmatimonadales bacterium]